MIGGLWYQRESNQRHTDFQSVALPAELWYQLFGEGKDRSFFVISNKVGKKVGGRRSAVSGQRSAVGSRRSLLSKIYPDFSSWSQLVCQLFHIHQLNDYRFADQCS
jgi:hypothetical protein